MRMKHDYHWLISKKKMSVVVKQVVVVVFWVEIEKHFHHLEEVESWHPVF